MTLERDARTRLTTAVVLLLVLAAGVVLGVALERQLEAKAVSGEAARDRGEERTSPERDRRPGDRARDASPRRASLLVEQVGLSEEQKEKVDSIVGYYRGQMRVLHEEFNAIYMSRYTEILETTRNAIRAVLDDAQRVAYDSLLVEFDQRVQQPRRRDSIGDTGDSRNER
jgi:hypothetical protein